MKTRNPPGLAIPRPHTLKPAPADFAAVAPGKGVKPLQAHYRAGAAVILRWLAEAGITPAEPIYGKALRKPVPADLAARARVMSRSSMATHYGVHFCTVEVWLKRAGIKALTGHAGAPRKPVPARSYAGPKSAFTGRLPQEHGEEAEAANVLRRYAAVYRCTEKGGVPLDHRNGLTHWRYGNAVFTGAELIERARAKGWNPNLWKVLAA